MNEFIKVKTFFRHLFDQERLADKAAVIVEAILAACSPRISEIAQHMAGHEAANYTMIQRFLDHVAVKARLLRLFQADAPFVIGDPTEMPRPPARQTRYVGKRKDGKPRGFWLWLLATPYRGRALACGFVTYCSKTIAQQARSRNPFHWQAFDEIRPRVLEREFRYLALLESLVQAQVNFVIRLNLARHPTCYDATGRKVTLTVSLGAQATDHGLRSLNQRSVNVGGVWRTGWAEPRWIMAHLAPEQALSLDAARMKIEEPVRDLKRLLNLDKLMNASPAPLEQRVALVLLAFTIGILAGETRRDALYGVPQPASNAPLIHSRRRKPPAVRCAANQRFTRASVSSSNARSRCPPNNCAKSTPKPPPPSHNWFCLCR